MPKGNYPKISIVIPAKNDAKGLETCLISIRKQTYPQDKLEVIVIDDNSTDTTATVAKRYNAKVINNIYNKKKVINRSEVGKAIGLHKATGEYIYILEQDIELKGNTFFQKLVYPLITDKSIVASFAREGNPNSKMTWVTRFISYHPLQCDPMYEYFSTSIEKCIQSINNNYWLLTYISFNIPPAGRMLFRISAVKNNESWNWPGFFDLDSVCALIKAGHTRFAYVPSAQIYHYHARTLSQLVFKRVRNLHMHFFPYQETSYFKWFDVSSKTGIAKILLWVIYANLIFPASIRGIYRAVKYKDAVLLSEPLITILTTDVLLFSLATSKEGRNLLKKTIRNIL